MNYKGRVSIVLIYVTIVIAWHSFYFLIDYQSAYSFLIEAGHIKWDVIFIPILFPLFWWLGLQYDRAKFLSEKDALTGLYNRRYVSEITPKLIAQAKRKQTNVTISLVDCNNFKSINDTYGHKTGDLVLTKISSILLECTNEKEIVSRWGGDEFLIISSHTNTKETNSKINDKLLVLSKALGFPVSLSIGTALYPTEATTLQDLLKTADRKMYDKKLKYKEDNLLKANSKVGR